MAKKRASGKRRNTDAGGQPIDPSYEDQVSAIRALMRSQNQINNLRKIGLDKTKTGNTSKQMEQAISNRQQAVRQILPPNTSPKAPDKLSGRTAEFGSRSLLEGMKSWMRGGGLRRGSM